jgi:hypothetical protein
MHQRAGKVLSTRVVSQEDVVPLGSKKFTKFVDINLWLGFLDSLSSALYAKIFYGEIFSVLEWVF